MIIDLSRGGEAIASLCENVAASRYNKGRVSGKSSVWPVVNPKVDRSKPGCDICLRLFLFFSLCLNDMMI